jgi:hypothetical protein
MVLAGLLAALFMGGAALAEPSSVSLVLVPEHHAVKDKSRLDGVFTGVLDAAGLGVSSGKIMLVRRSVVVGSARMEPLLNVSMGHAGALLRFAF